MATAPSPSSGHDGTVHHDSEHPDPTGVVLAIHAHPDDEVFATAAATLAGSASGRRIELRVLTGGEGRSATLTPSGLREARRRRAERLDRSASLLGIDSWAYIDEGRWTDTPHDPDRTLASARFQDVVDAVLTEIESVSPSTVLTVGADGLTGHRDHVVCHHAVSSAVDQITTRRPLCLGAMIDTMDVAAARRRAHKLVGTDVGSGRTTGSDTSHGLRLDGPPGTEARRREALDAYTPDLGTADVESMLRLLPTTSDSLLMRLILDHRGWDHDCFESLPNAEQRGARVRSPPR